MEVFEYFLIVILINSLIIQICDGDKNPIFNNLITFDEYLAKYQISVHDQATYLKYKAKFLQTQKEVINFNAKPNRTYTQGINQFAHLTLAEIIKSSFGLSLLRYPILNVQPKAIIKPPCVLKPIDWTKSGAVTPVKKQGNCGNCFIFSAVAAIESATYIKTNKTYVLSEQYAMDCLDKDLKINNNACNGGQPDYIYDLVISKKGLPLNSSYPYTGNDNKVCPVKNIVSDTAIKGYITLFTDNEDTIVCNLIKGGPMSVAVFVNSTFLKYSGGIYNDVASCKPDLVLNHAILMVGYDIDPKTKLEYYIFKNSWGPTFGENGYIRMQKGINLCGITSLVQQPSFIANPIPIG
ncbi:hypothetical protein PVAND_004990 [Polypedilum vanderplanki]|uniref:Uncharacterized protein n=1 Tax=Polypedilum vanderplanki TaxID=319348 RepID=A0A9J6BYS9_POLVA|nr:hypothetical protein PVAND_004990 [Polypedilum vanderplanki]